MFITRFYVTIFICCSTSKMILCINFFFSLSKIIKLQLRELTFYSSIFKTRGQSPLKIRPDSNMFRASHFLVLPSRPVPLLFPSLVGISSNRFSILFSILHVPDEIPYHMVHMIHIGRGEDFFQKFKTFH